MKMLPAPSTLILVVLLLLFALSSSSFGAEITLSNVDDFTNFVNKVNSGGDYSEDTVYLGSDITLSGSIDPIGTNGTYQFRGVFDGQGYVINNFKTSSSSQHTGLFGFSDGLTIRNVVLDGSCSITTSAYSSDSSSASGFIGGIIGKFYAASGECNIENNVNMANVTFGGSSDNLYIGGIAGYLFSNDHSVHVKNCVNYGSVTDSGSVGSYAELGGIVGISQGSSSYNYIQNCLNYGTITHSGETFTGLYIGGIVGYGNTHTYIENCVSSGKISTQTKSGNVGGIVGRIFSNIYINYCYYTTDVGVSSIKGTGTLSSTTGISDSPTNVNSDLVSKLNSNATSYNWSKWLLNVNNMTVTFKASDDKELSFSSQIILIPNPVKEGNSFLFWCKDTECTEEFEAESVSERTYIYAKWIPNNYTVTFDFGNGTVVNVTFTYNTEIIYPEDKKEGYTLSWDNYHEPMPARDITVTAQWTPNNYTVSFDLDNGTTVNETFTYSTEIVYPKEEGYTLSWDNYHELMPARDITVTAQWTPNNYTVSFDANGGSVSETSKIVTFNREYGGLPKPTRAGHMFIGWFTDETNGTEITNETIVSIPFNHTLYAHWEEVTTQVEIVFSSKDLTEEEATNIVKQYTNANFTITNFEKDDEIKIVIKFADKEDAENFVESIKESSGMNHVKRVSFIPNDDGSFSTIVYPLPFLSFLFL